MKHYRIIFIFIALFCAGTSISAANEDGNLSAKQAVPQNPPSSVFIPSSIKLQSEYYNNSSDFNRKGFGAEFGFNFGGLSFESGYVFTDFSQDGFKDIQRDSLFILGEKQISEKTSILFRLSENYYNHDNSNLNAGIFMRTRAVNNVFAEISLRRFDIVDTVLPFNNIIYNYVATMGALVRDVKSDDYKVYLLYTPESRVAFAGEFVYGDYSDGNEKHSLMFESSYQLLDMPHLRAAYNYFYLDIKDLAPLVQRGNDVESSYWDPVNFETHTLRLELRHNYNNLSLSAETSLSYSPKSNGFSRAVFLFASYSLTRPLSLRFDARWFDSDEGIDRLGGDTDRYRATNYNIGLQYKF